MLPGMWQDNSQVHIEAEIPQDPLPLPSEAAIPTEPIGSAVPLTAPPMDPAPPQADIPFLGHVTAPLTAAPMDPAPLQADVPFLGHVPPELMPPVHQAPVFNNGIYNPVGGPFVTVYSGGLIGRLHLEFFQCPGIHEPCIEFGGELITPKDFANRADKGKQKDWKVSIRTGARTLRFMMETKAIDFYNHKELCSGKCQGRNQGHYGKIKPDCVRNVPVPAYPTAPMYNPSYQYNPYPLPQHPVSMPQMQQSYYPMQNPMAYYPPPQQSIMCPPAPAPFPQQVYYPPASGNFVQEDQMTYAVLDNPTVSPTPAAPGVMTTEYLMNIVVTDPVMFWNEVHRIGLLPDFLETIGNNVSGLRLSAMDPNSDIGNIAPTLTGLIGALDLKPYVASRIQTNQTASYGTMPFGDINNPLPLDQTAPCYNQAPVQNPYGADLSASLFYPLYNEDCAVDPEVVVANTEHQDPMDHPPQASSSRAPKRRRFVIKYGESEDEDE